jgi:mono/diheme cytochrome c family protein
VVFVLVVATGCASPPQDLRLGRDVYGDTCSICHGDRGEGATTGPALDRVLDTFPDCLDHMMWISLGSEGWIEINGATYGAEATPVTGGMPPQEGILRPIEIAAVAAYQRAEHGGISAEEALRQCGLPDE